MIRIFIVCNISRQMLCKKFLSNMILSICQSQLCFYALYDMHVYGALVQANYRILSIILLFFLGHHSSKKYILSC